ncbi:hypothetical protein ACQE3D_10820 [Methylomonas sp. MS20]|uniref:hypothetical protein n=1 Tax=unclassified Methylomonas TaxID=2608980 RepID=UPI0028A53D23|nr:hypothetical protein [Methylomonas sp. MV1]MDT4328510.1 hypothetical protein [Methylomonas sp. MV1]
MTNIVIDTNDDDQIEIFANGVLVGSYNHDEDGYEVMERAEALAVQIGYALGIEVVRQ